MTGPRFAYLHGLASGPLSRKGQHLARRFSEHGIALQLPDLGRPSFAEQSPAAAALAEVDRFAENGTWCFIGSSFGGFVGAQWAEQNPARVDRLVLLCPAFDLASRWPEVPCETLIVHGTRDEVVPIESSRRYAAARPHVALLEVDDDHGLITSSDRIALESLRFFAIARTE